MNVLYLIGNGFDLAQGLKTRYMDFYPYYIDRSIDRPAIRKICENIGSDFNTWADLELRLGQYSAEIGEGDFDEVYYDLSDCLREYLKRETSGFFFSDDDVKKIQSDLLEPYKYLRGRDQMLITNMYGNTFGGHTHHINVISFNYTKILDLALPSENMILGSAQGHNVFYDSVYHIHGSLDKTILLGVNDEAQIANQDFVKNDDIKDLLVKPQANDAIRSVESQICQSLIANADLIVLYGLSIGETDKCWWQHIGKRMLENLFTKVIIFKYEEDEVELIRAQKLGAKRRRIVGDLLNKMGLTSKDTPSERIYVSLDKSFLASSLS